MYNNDVHVYIFRDYDINKQKNNRNIILCTLLFSFLIFKKKNEQKKYYGKFSSFKNLFVNKNHLIWFKPKC